MEIRRCAADTGQSEEDPREEARKGGYGDSIKYINICYDPFGQRLVEGGREAVCAGDEDEHPSTLTSMANLASTYRSQGRLGAENPDTLTSMGNLAFTWKNQGRRSNALALMEGCAQARPSESMTARAT